MGAAIQAGVLSGDVKDILLLDVTPLTLGLETKGGIMTKLIDRNSTIPTSKSEVFSTAEDNQSSVEVHVLQGEREMAAGNKSLGRFQLTGIPSAPRGIPQVEVTFDIDANGILNVSAKDLGTAKEQTVQIQSGGGLSDDEIKKMVRDAERNAGDDRKAKELAEARNLAEQLIYQTDRGLEENSDAILEGDRELIMTQLSELRHAVEGQEVSVINDSSLKLQTSWQEVSERIQMRSQAQDNISSNEAAEDAEEVVDAEVVE